MASPMKNNNVFVNLTARTARALDRLGGLLATAFAVTFLTASPARADIYIFNNLIGSAATLDHTDGSGANARLLNPTGVAVDGAGNIYIADGGDHTVRKVTSGGVVTTLAGGSGQVGSSDGVGTNARFVYPFGIAVDGAGTVYVTDIGNQNIRRIMADGSTTTLAGTT